MRVDGGDGRSGPARVKALLVDPVEMRVVWMNDAATQALRARGIAPAVPLPVETAMSVTEAPEVHAVLERVAATGASLDVRVDVVSTRRGSMEVVVSADRLPDGTVLVLVENAWRFGRRGASRPPGHENGRGIIEPPRK
ncbi:MAG: hypothetical protein ISP10_04340 [Aeromicrobium sp.]|nr:hypothetical protein [Aeromicrobium sp.]